MSKHYGEAYDPALRKTEHGASLYQAWKKVIKNVHCEEWGHFPTFYNWAMQNCYEVGAWLKREDNNAPFAPNNCYWYLPSGRKRVPSDFADKWNATVNRIRKHYGMPPLRGTDYGD
jgi:hypothetical protein